MNAPAEVPAPLMTLSGVDLGYRRNVVLSGVDLTIHRQEFLGIVGPNGSGKTTLLRTILGNLPPLAGTVQVHAGRRADGLRFGYVPQVQTMERFYPLNALDIVVMGTYGDLPAWRAVGATERRRAAEALERVGMAELATRAWQDLSGGQQQRLLIARALAAEAEILVLDEPTNGMDLRGEHEIMELVCRLRENQGLTILMVTHLLNLVVHYAERFVILDRGRVVTGKRDTILTGPHLEQLYGVPVQVGMVAGRRVVVPGRRQDA